MSQNVTEEEGIPSDRAAEVSRGTRILNGRALNAIGKVQQAFCLTRAGQYWTGKHADIQHEGFDGILLQPDAYGCGRCSDGSGEGPGV